MLQTRKSGPFIRGVIDRANPSLDLRGAVKRARSFEYNGAGRLAVRAGDALALTLKDDQGTPASVTSVCALVAFSDGALAVAHSTNTNKAYLYRLNSTLTDWYNAAGSLQGTTNPEPVAVLWTSITTPPDVLIAEGLGEAYIAHTEGADSATLAFPTKKYTQPATVVTLTADLDGSGGAESLYFLGVVSHKNHLWAWGFGSGTIAANGYRPELARYSAPSFGAFSSSDSITIGDRVRSQREKVIAGVSVGDALYLGGPYLLSRITGFGRNSWVREQLAEKKFGVVGPKAACAAGGDFFAWGPRGPYRCRGGGPPEPLWDAVSAAVELAVNVSKVVAVFDESTDQVRFYYDAGSGVRTVMAYNVVREVWLGPDDDVGLAIRAAATIAPVYASTAAPTLGPAGAPTSASTTEVTTSSAKANWSSGDGSATTRIEYRRQSDTAWTTAVTGLSAGVTSYTITGLTAGVAYEWRAAHDKDGITSSYLGPAAGTQFTTSSTTLSPPTTLSLSSSSIPGYVDIRADWANAESDAQVEVYLSGPSVGAPGAGTYILRETRDTPAASSSATALRVSATGTYWVKIRHTKSSFTESAYAGPSSIAVTVEGVPE